MLFVTDEFLVFFLVVFVLYWTVSDRFRFVLLIGASLYFYASWSLPFTFHLLAVVATNYVVMEVWRRKRWNWIFYALQTANVLNIAMFKYFYFFADVLGLVTGIADLREPYLREVHRAMGHEITLPLAISFYTFQIMAYGIDIFRGSYTRVHTFRSVLLFKSFFPQLIAGPIMRSHELLPQIERLSSERGARPHRRSIYKGLWLVMTGVFKKVVIASTLLGFIAPLFSKGAQPFDYHPAMLWIGTYAALAMLYADFSAYTDLARGFGALLGFRIPVNFKAPFFSISMGDYWRRWHLTFSRWIRDYVYIPLGGSRVSRGRLYFNYIFTFFLAGLWHGASYTFVLWGTLVGVILAVEATIRSFGIPEWPKPIYGKVARFVFTWVCFLASAMFFFAPSWEWSVDAMLQMWDITAWLDFELLGLPRLEALVFGLAAVMLFNLIEEKPGWFVFVRQHERWLLPIAAAILLVFMTQFSGRQQDFFYFQF